MDSFLPEVRVPATTRNFSTLDALMARGHSMSVSEHVKEVTRKNPFGDEFYNVPSNEMLFKKPLLCCEMKTRNGSFLEKTARD